MSSNVLHGRTCGDVDRSICILSFRRPAELAFANPGRAIPGRVGCVVLAGIVRGDSSTNRPRKARFYE